MWGDSYYGNFIFARAVTPEYTIGSWRSVLSVGFEDLLIGSYGGRSELFSCV